MKKRGFTLIELLAVVVILTIIGVIATPIVFHYIEISRQESFEISVSQVIEAAKEYVLKTEETNDFPPGGIDISQVKLSLKKNNLKSGIVKRDENGVIVAENIYDGRYCASGSKNHIIVKKIGSQKECQGIDTTPPELKVKVNHTTASTITVVAIAKDSLSQIKSYEYCIGDICSGEKKENHYTFEDLKPGQTYTIRVTVKNEHSGVGSYQDHENMTDTTVEIKATTDSLEKARFRVSTSGYAGAKEVTIIYPEGSYQYQYEILDMEGNRRGNLEEVKEREVSLNIQENGIIRAYVKEGNITEESELYIVGIDQIGPEVVVIMDDKWEKTKQIKVIAKDPTGIATKGYSYDGGINWSSNTYRTYHQNQKVKLIVRDKLGNITNRFKVCKDEEMKDCYETDEIEIGKVDNTPPVCQLKVASGIRGFYNWYRSNVTIDFDLVRDEESGVVKQQIDQPNLINDGNYVVRAMVEDAAGNQGTCQLAVKIDQTSPSVILKTATSTIDSITIPMTIGDNGSGISSTTCKYSTVNGRYTTNASSLGTTGCIIRSLAEKTRYYYQVCATDQAGNTTCKEGNAMTKEIPRYTIQYHNNGGQGSMLPTTCIYGNACSLRPVSFTKIGYHFAGWAISANGGVVYSNGQSVSNLTTNGGTVTLYAKWAPNTNTVYTVKHLQLKLDGENYELVETKKSTGTTGKNVTPEVNTYTGFSSPKTQTVKIAADGSTVVEYRYLRNSYSLTVKAGDGIKSVTGGSIGVFYGARVSVGYTLQDGYHFDRWTGDQIVSTFNMPASDVTMTANGKVNTYQIKYNKNGGSGTDMKSTNCIYNEACTLRKNTYTKTGYTFDGWSKEKDGSGEKYKDKESVSNLTTKNNGTVTLYATWKKASSEKIYHNPILDMEVNLSGYSKITVVSMDWGGHDGYEQQLEFKCPNSTKSLKVEYSGSLGHGAASITVAEIKKNCGGSKVWINAFHRNQYNNYCTDGHRFKVILEP